MIGQVRRISKAEKEAGCVKKPFLTASCRRTACRRANHVGCSDVSLSPATIKPKKLLSCIYIPQFPAMFAIFSQFNLPTIQTRVYNPH